MVIRFLKKKKPLINCIKNTEVKNKKQFKLYISKKKNISIKNFIVNGNPTIVKIVIIKIKLNLGEIFIKPFKEEIFLELNLL